MYRNLIRNIQKAQAVIVSDNLKEATEKIYKACKNSIGFQSGYISLFSKTNQKQEVLFIDSDEAITLKGAFSPLSIMEESIIDNDILKERWREFWSPKLINLSNVLYSPIIFDNETIGFFFLVNKEGGFMEHDLGIASIFSHITAIALNNLSTRLKMAESEQKYRDLFNNIPVGLYVTDSMEQIVDMNKKMLELLDIKSLKEFEGEDLSNYYINPQNRIGWQNNLKTDSTIQYSENQFKGPNGEVLWVSENAHFIKDSDGQQYCEVIMEDITTRKRSEKALNETYVKLQSANKELNERAKWMESLNESLFELAEEITEENIFNTVLSNLVKNFEVKLTGLAKFSKDLSKMTFKEFNCIETELKDILKPEYKLTRKDLSILNSSSGRMVMLDDYSDLFNTIDTELVNLLYRLSKKGSDSIILIPIKAEKILSGNILVILKKTTLSENQKYYLENMAKYLSMALENKNLYEKLSQSYAQLESAQEAMKKQERIKAMGQIASGITHDINNTLGPITLYTEALIETEDNLSERAIRFLKIIQNAVSDIENVTQRLRAFYKHNEILKTEKLLIKDLFEELIELTRPKWESIPNKDGVIIKIETIINDPDASIMGCRSDIRESLVNCIFNAVDAMPNGGTITLIENTEEGNIKITIGDEGIGMTEEQISHCLEPFYTTKGAAGTGLGLAEVYGMMERHGGRVEIESYIEKGTQINLIFPTAVPGEEYETVPMEKVKIHPMRILCVDDDIRILEGLKEMFSLDDHTTEVAQSGADALKILKSKAEQNDSFDVIITDLGMPGMDGFDFAAASKKIYPETPIVMLSGWGNQINKVDNESKDVCYVLPKPPRIKVLREVLAGIAKKDSLNREEL